ncbi:hypothetical protein EV424DRAFT_830253 [Suillus variegatus]|nr:hypothetical protein EV424DRAFT_830253 [Suillus variegatus]
MPHETLSLVIQLVPVAVSMSWTFEHQAIHGNMKSPWQFPAVGEKYYDGNGLMGVVLWAGACHSVNHNCRQRSRALLGRSRQKSYLFCKGIPERAVEEIIVYACRIY